jgi:hypothetical protein
MVDSLGPDFDIALSDDALPAGPLIAAPRDPHVQSTVRGSRTQLLVLNWDSMRLARTR